MRSCNSSKDNFATTSFGILSKYFTYIVPELGKGYLGGHNLWAPIITTGMISLSAALTKWNGPFLNGWI